MCLNTSCWWEIQGEKSYLCSQFMGITLAMEGTASICYSTDILNFFKIFTLWESRKKTTWSLQLVPCSWTASFGFSARKGVTMGLSWESALWSTGKHWHAPGSRYFDSFAKLQKSRLLQCDRKWNDSTRELLTAHSPCCLPLTEFAST